MERLQIFSQENGDENKTVWFPFEQVVNLVTQNILPQLKSINSQMFIHIYFRKSNKKEESFWNMSLANTCKTFGLKSCNVWSVAKPARQFNQCMQILNHYHYLFFLN